MLVFTNRQTHSTRGKSNGQGKSAFSTNQKSEEENNDTTKLSLLRVHDNSEHYSPYALTFGKYSLARRTRKRRDFSKLGAAVQLRTRRISPSFDRRRNNQYRKTSSSVRLFGAGHSFNDGVVSDYTLVSLDNYKGVVSEDPANNRVTVKGGTRIREVIKLLLDRGLAFASLPSHDAQSIAGIISTDVHGTGKNWGFVSELVHSIKVIDGNGDVHVCEQTDDLFGAAIGGVGAVGIISEVTVNAVPRFNIEQICIMKPLSECEAELEQLIQDNDHMSLYIFPFAEKCQINIWNRTDKPQSFLGDLREFITISLDALTSAWFGNLMAYTGTLKEVFQHRLLFQADNRFSFWKATRLYANDLSSSPGIRIHRAI